MGNVVLWKPSDTAVLSNYIIYQILEEAGIPPGVISYLPSDGPVFGNTVCDNKHLAAINFTGSVPTFKYIWKRVGGNLDKYISYPKLIGGLFKITENTEVTEWFQNVVERISILFIHHPTSIPLQLQPSGHLTNIQVKNVVPVQEFIFLKVNGNHSKINLAQFINKSNSEM